MNEQQDNSVIVVGVDGSQGAKAALRFALQEATRRQATLRAVHAWRFGYIGVTGIEGFSPLYGADLGELRHNAEVFLTATLDEVASDGNGVVLEGLVVEGSAATVLVDQSRSADLLVVGSRGHGGFAGLLLGSVSQQCAQHAACPVVIVRPPTEQQ